MFTPEYLFSEISHITPAFLKEKGITALALDVDNTLTAHNSQELPAQVLAWLAEMRRAGIRLTILSNNTKKRVGPLAKRLGLEYVSLGCKPLTVGVRIARKRLGVPKSAMALVGDQLFTDRLCGWLYGMTVLMVQPLAPDIKKGILFRRKLEQPFVRRYHARGGKLL